MDNLYKKIYEAIDTGIQKALVLPDEMADDISVRFRHKKLSNDVNIMDDYVRNLLDGDDTEYYYGQILEYYKEMHKKYKANDFNELTNIFNKIKDIKYLNTSWIDMSDTVIIILDNGQEIPFDQFNPNIHIVKFIKFKNNITCHDIIFHKDLLFNKKGKWIEKNVEKLNFNNTECINKEKYDSPDKARQMAEHDYNGYSHTYNNADIESNKRDINNYLAFIYCIKDLKNIDQKYEAYLPAIGELMFLNDNLYLINYILKTIKGKKLDFNDWFWSSTENDYNHIWTLYFYNIRHIEKTHVFGIVLPFFALK